MCVVLLHRELEFLKCWSWWINSLTYTLIKWHLVLIQGDTWCDLWSVSLTELRSMDLHLVQFVLFFLLIFCILWFTVYQTFLSISTGLFQNLDQNMLWMEVDKAKQEEATLVNLGQKTNSIHACRFSKWTVWIWVTILMYVSFRDLCSCWTA